MGWIIAFTVFGLIFSANAIQGPSDAYSGDEFYLPESSIENLIQPCDGLEGLSCKNFNEYEVSSKLEDIFDIFRNRTLEKLINILNKPAAENELRAFTNARNLYQSCMKFEISSESYSKIVENVANELGGFPVAKGNSSNESNFDWKEFAYKCRKLGYSYGHFVNLSITPADVVSPHIPPIFISPPELEIIKSTYRELAKIRRIFHFNTTEEMEDQPNWSLIFDNYLGDDFFRIFGRYSRTFGKLYSSYPSVPWKEFLENILPSNITLQDDYPLIVEERAFFENFEKFMKEISKRDQENYAKRYVLADFLHRIIKMTNSDVNVVESQSARCASMVDNQLPEAVNTLYKKEIHDLDKITKMVMDMTEKLRRILLRKISTSKMVLDSKYPIIEKIKQFKVNFMDSPLSEEETENLYKNLELSEDDLVGNTKNLTIFHTNREFYRLYDMYRLLGQYQPIIRHNGILDFLPYYDTTSNTLYLRYGLTQAPYFYHEKYTYRNYGTLGLVISRKMMGIVFGKNRYQIMKGSCEFFEKYQFSSALQLAYYGFLESIKDNQELKTLQKSPKQLFWSNVGAGLCSKNPNGPTSMYNIGKKTIENELDFLNYFGCSGNLSVHQKDECSLW